MIHPTLRAELEPITKAYQRFLLWRGLSFCWASAAAASGVVLLLYWLTHAWLPMAVPVIAVATAAAAGAIWFLSNRNEPAYRWIAQQIERENPKLNSLLLAAL